MTTIQNWFDTMRDIWLNQEPDRIAGLLSDDIEFHEDPREPPLTSVAEIVNVWQEIKGQDIEYVEIDILYEADNVGMALWRFKEHNQPEHIGSYFLKLDENGKCRHFRQWWNVRET